MMTNLRIGFLFFALIIFSGVMYAKVPNKGSRSTIDSLTVSKTAFWGHFKKGDFIHYYMMKDILRPQSYKYTIPKDSIYVIPETINIFQEIMFNYQGIPIPYIIFPNDSLQIVIESRGSFTLKSGSSTRQNELDLQFQLHERGVFDFNFSYQNDKKIKESYNQNLSKIREMVAAKKISLEFSKIFGLFVTTRYINQLISPLLNSDTPKYHIDFDQLRNLLPMHPEYTGSMYSYTQTLSNLVKAKTFQKTGSSTNILDLFNTTVIDFDGQIKEYLIALLIANKLHYGTFDFENKELFLNEISSEKFKTIISQYYNLEKELKQNILTTKLTSFDGTPFLLADLLVNRSDTLIYIDFWASWCHPCREEFKFYPKLLSKYKDKIKFLFLSVDENMENWKNANMQYNDILNKNNSFLLVDGNNSTLSKEIKLTSIPRYILVSKGKILNEKAPRPSVIGIDSFLEHYFSPDNKNVKINN